MNKFKVGATFTYRDNDRRKWLNGWCGEITEMHTNGFSFGVWPPGNPQKGWYNLRIYCDSGTTADSGFFTSLEPYFDIDYVAPQEMKFVPELSDWFKRK